MSDNYDPVSVPVIQPGNVGDGLGSLVTRQRGLDAVPFASVDPTPPPFVIQGSHEIHTTRQTGNGASRFLGDTLIADHASDDGTLYADIALVPTGEANRPAPLVPSDMPLPGRPTFVEPTPAAATGAAPAVGVMQSDQPGDGGADPRDRSSGPQVFSADKLPVVRKAPIVPVVISASGTAQMARVKKGKR